MSLDSLANQIKKLNYFVDFNEVILAKLIVAFQGCAAFYKQHL